jgi:hypothetical protein
MRENLGQIESRGVSVDYELTPMRWLAVDGGYQYAHATVTKNNPETTLVGNWIPEVARNLATMNVRAFKPALGTLNLQGRLSGRQFDDDANLTCCTDTFVWTPTLRTTSASGLSSSRRAKICSIGRLKTPRRLPQRWECRVRRGLVFLCGLARKCENSGSATAGADGRIVG